MTDNTNTSDLTITPARLPEGGLLFREPFVSKRHPWREPLSAAQRAQVDARYVLYDLFLRADGDELIGIGPPLLNLRSSLLPIRAWVDGTPTRSPSISTLAFIRRRRLLVRPKNLILRFPLPGNTRRAAYDVRIEFGHGLSFRGEIRRDPPLKHHNLTLVTLQKDNRPRWIGDWARYYRLAHGVDHILLYDNASEDVPAAREAVARQGGCLIRWDAPYGPDRFWDNHFTQWGALNHARLRFGARGPMLNFDIDELLVIKSPRVRQMIQARTVNYFDQYAVPWQQPSRDDFSFIDFSRRHADPVQGAWKYSFSPLQLRYNEVHFAYPKGISFLTIHGAPRPAVPVRDAYFLHYFNISTNWKGPKRRELDPTLLVEDRAALDVLGRRS